MDEIAPADIRRARRAYYAVMSWLDERVGRVLETLDAIGEKDRTIVVLSADHGDMLGERGLWFKMCFFEWSVRVPMIVHAPGMYRPRRVKENVSLLDLFPTFLEWAGDGDPPELVAPTDGTGIAGLAAGSADGWPDTAYSEYCGEGAESPILMVRRGRWKYIHCEDDPPLLYDLESDPDELENLAGTEAARAVESELREAVFRQWNPADLKQRVIESQRRRLFLHEALTIGRRTPWDFNPIRDASREYVRDDGDIQGIYDPAWSDQKR